MLFCSKPAYSPFRLIRVPLSLVTIVGLRQETDSERRPHPITFSRMGGDSASGKPKSCWSVLPYSSTVPKLIALADKQVQSYGNATVNSLSKLRICVRKNPRFVGVGPQILVL